MRHFIFLDTETQSAEDLKAVGAKKYINHESTRLMSIVLKDGKDILTWIPSYVCPSFLTPKHLELSNEPNRRYFISQYMPDEMFSYFDGDHTLVAHNAEFDKLVVEKFISSHPNEWFDTVPRARAGGYPGALDPLCKYLFGEGKHEGHAAMMILTKVKIQKGKYVYPVGTLPVWKSMIHYNISDVIQLEKIHDIVKNYGETNVINLDRKINQRGIYVDKSLVRRMLSLYSHNEIVSQDKLDSVAHGVNIKSHQQVKAWLKDRGYDVLSLNKQALEQFFNNPESYEDAGHDGDYQVESVIEMLKLRQNIVRAGVHKIERMWILAHNEDDRIKDQFVYHGAITGRFSGRQLQPHNFPKGSEKVNVEEVINILKDEGHDSDYYYEKILTLASKANISPSEVLSTITRSCLTAAPGKTLGIVDYAQIEARCVAWISDEIEMLEAFMQGRDLYKEMSSVIFGVDVADVTKEQRQIGKIVVLGCGYGMSAGKFDANCRIMYNVKLEAVGTDAKQCIDGYRKKWAKISGGLNGPRLRTGIWQQLHDAVHTAINYGESEAGKCQFEYSDETLVLTLPSGRSIYYRNARIEDRVPSYCKLMGIEERLIPTVCYDHPRGYEGTLYGGLLTENICQAISRDFMVQAMIDIDTDEMDTAIHVHDEIVDEFPEEEKEARLRDQCEIMSTVPDWAVGFPLKVEGFTCKYYSKSPFRDSIKLTYQNGVELHADKK